MTTIASSVSEKILLDAITTVFSHYITETNPYILFNGLLDVLLDITESEYGFIGEVFYSDDQKPFVKNYATTDISWSADTQQLYEETKEKGMIFSKLDSLYGAVLTTGQLIIANQPATDPRRYGLPQGHPPLHSFMGMPFYGGGQLLGMVGIANRPTGYQRELADLLQPFLISCGNLIQAYKNNKKHQQVEIELCSYKTKLLKFTDNIQLTEDSFFILSPPSVMKQGNLVFLTPKELKLLEILVLNRNNIINTLMIEKHVWNNTIVGESSLRALMRRLRKKLPDLEIKTVSGQGYTLLISI